MFSPRKLFGLTCSASLVATSLVALLGASNRASAATIIDTIQGAPFNNAGFGYIVSQPTPGTGEAIGLQFFLASPTTITSVEAYIFQFQVAGSSGTLGIMNNVSGLPSGTFITGDSSPITPGAGPVNLTSLNWSLSAGTYWLVGAANLGSSLGWQANQILPGITFAFTSDGSGAVNWVADGGIQETPMALITGSPTGTAPSTPLPTTLPLFATGLGALGVLAWRRKGQVT